MIARFMSFYKPGVTVCLATTCHYLFNRSYPLFQGTHLVFLFSLLSGSTSIGLNVSTKAMLPWNYTHTSHTSCVFRCPESVRQLSFSLCGLKLSSNTAFSA